MKYNEDLVGVIPAGGKAVRLGKIPCSKEIYPLKIWETEEPKVTSEYLVKYLQQAGCSYIFFIIKEGKWDIPAYFGDGERFSINIGYLLSNLPYGTPFTLDQSYPYIKDKYVALGFPDLIIKPENSI